MQQKLIACWISLLRRRGGQRSESALATGEHADVQDVLQLCCAGCSPRTTPSMARVEGSRNQSQARPYQRPRSVVCRQEAGTSAQGVPPTPPNSERDRSLVDRISEERRAHPRRTCACSPTRRRRRRRAADVEPSYGTLDMEAEIRRRRAAASGSSGWYTPNSPNHPSPSRLTSTSISLCRRRRASASHRPTSRLSPMPVPSLPLPHRRGAVDDLHTLQAAEAARRTQAQQQTEISRYLNELNAWLERDVVDRTHEWRTLAHGVTQLSDELRALKEGRVLTSTASPSWAMLPRVRSLMLWSDGREGEGARGASSPTPLKGRKRRRRSRS